MAAFEANMRLYSLNKNNMFNWNPTRQNLIRNWSFWSF